MNNSPHSDPIGAGPVTSDPWRCLTAANQRGRGRYKSETHTQQIARGRLGNTEGRSERADRRRDRRERTAKLLRDGPYYKRLTVTYYTKQNIGIVVFVCSQRTLLRSSAGLIDWGQIG